jgi:hypothetical protein
MEKGNEKKTTGEAEARAATGETSFCGCRPSCCSGMEFSAGMSGKWKDFCKGMPGPEEMHKMMKMCFPEGKKDKQQKA